MKFEPAITFADAITNARYPQADRIKVGKKEFHNTVEAAYVAGQLSAIEGMLNSHMKNPYSDVDSVMGDIHIALAETWEHLRKLNPKAIPRMSLEQILKDQGLSV